MDDLGLDFDNIVVDEEQPGDTVDKLFGTADTTQEKEPEKAEETPQTKPSTVPEKEQDSEVDSSPAEEGGSPELFSSIATTLKEQGVLSSLEDEDLKGVKSAEDIVNLFSKELDSRLDERQKRINDAINADLPQSDIKQYENTISYLNSIDAAILNDESNEKLRSQLIAQDFLNRGFSEDRVRKEVEKSIAQGTDIDDAKEALESCKQFYQAQYKNKIDSGRQKETEARQAITNKTEALKKTIMDEDSVFGVAVDKNMRNRIIKNISDASYKTKDGQYLTALQRAQNEDPVDFMHKLGFLFSITNGFKDIDGLINAQVKKETSKNLKDFEAALVKGTRKLSDGNLRRFGSSEEDSSFLSLDV